MNVHGAGDHDVRRLGIHYVEDGVDDFIAAHAEDGGSQDVAGFGVNQDLHEALRFAFFYRAADLGHGALADQRRPPAAANFGFGHSGAAERRIDVEIVRRDAVGQPAGI